MKKLLFLSFILTSVLAQSQTFADRYVPSHLCFKPEKPLFMATPYHQELYKNDVKKYKFCIRDFVTSQERTIVIHQEAIKKATNDWNEFVQEDQE